MISPEYFSFRWSWYRPILNRGENPADRCRVESRRLPIRVSGQDAGEYIPYAVHSEIDQKISTSLRRLQEYAIRYMVKGDKVSAHQLPTMDAHARAMTGYLRKQFPHLPMRLLHHWCADEKGAPALLSVWQGLWGQGWKQDQLDVAPWVPAVNVLILRLMRQGIAALPSEEEATTGHVMLCVVGGLYVWALQEFLKKYLEGVVEVTRIASYESMMLPSTPMAFLREQPDDSLLGDDRNVIRAYGLEADIVPRMRQLREKVGPKNEGGILALLARDKLGEHLLRRTWARLSLWQLAVESGYGGWMEYVLQAKKLDQLLGGQVLLEGNALDSLKNFRDKPLAAWLLAQMKGGRDAKLAGEPWLRDDITLNAFRVFEEDVRVEIRRRKVEKTWLDRKSELAPKARGGEADKIFEQAYQDGELVFIQPDVNRSLHSGKSLALRQGCLRVEWSDYLAGMLSLHGSASANFIEQRFLAGVLNVLEQQDNLFVDECSSSGCLLRGSVVSLVQAGVALRSQLREWYMEISDNDEASMPSLSMCVAMIGEWMFAKMNHAKLGECKIAFALAVPQADAGVSRDCGVGRLIAYRDYNAGLKPLGGVRVETVDSGTGQSVNVLYNNGLAMTSPVVSELVSVLSNKASIRELRLEARQTSGVLDGYRLPQGGLNLVVIQMRGEDTAPLLLVRAGKPCLGGVDVDVFELLDAESRVARRIIDHGLPHWGR
ncbi:MAG TPA: hypothetical protein VKA31_01640 [Mariprofundaceae bacterium]|nr:hypothetical protein [Mariprofundaceae bacterium]